MLTQGYGLAKNWRTKELRTKPGHENRRIVIILDLSEGLGTEIQIVGIKEC